ncbi:Myb family transcription factor PHL7 [Linum perenne]
MGSSRSDGANKERLRWTQELHDRFEEAVNQLGGPDIIGFATNFRGHSQGYPEGYGHSWTDHLSCQEPPTGGIERRNISEMLPNFSATSGAQLNEALQMQLEVERRLSDHLDVQRNLKLKIEAQGRFLERMVEEHRNRAAFSKPKLFPTMSLPSLCDESESNNTNKEDESDSEGDRVEVQSAEVFRALKRLRTENDVLPPRYKITPVVLPPPVAAVEPFAGNMMYVEKDGKYSYPTQGINFAWNNMASCPSTLVPSFF